MNDPQSIRNYRLAGNQGVVNYDHEEWYVCDVSRKRMKQLMRRSDSVAFQSYIFWLATLFAAGVLAFMSLGSWWALPAFLIYGVLYGSCSESRFHECLHGTPFRWRLANEFFLIVFGFMSLKNPYLWRWSHARHHTDTIIVGRDPEIAFPRPPDVLGMAMNLLHLKTGIIELQRAFRACFGQLSEDEILYVPKDERGRVYLHARIQLGVLTGVSLFSVYTGSIVPLLFVGLPTFYGSFVHHLLAATQHAGLAEDIPDHRLNTRTVYLNPVFSFIYSNMNYHLEHHMFPMVPFYALPALHEEIKADCPPAYRGVIAAYKEMIPALLRQMRDPQYFVRRELPQGAGEPHPTAVKLQQVLTPA